MPKKIYLFIFFVSRFSPYKVSVYQESGEGLFMKSLYQNDVVYDLEEELIDVAQRFEISEIGTNAESEDDFRHVEKAVEAIQRYLN